MVASHKVAGPVYVNSAGQAGHGPSSRRFKKDIADMGTASEALSRPASGQLSL